MKNTLKLTVSLVTLVLIAACQNSSKPPVSVDYSKIKLANGNIVKDGETYIPAWVRNEKQINEVLIHQHHCADNLVLRYQAMSEQDITDSCDRLKNTQARFSII